MHKFIAALTIAIGFSSAYAEPQMRSEFLEVNNEKYHYLSMGDPSKSIILFVHGFPEFSLTWREQLKYFSDRFHAVAVDMRGYNLSSKPANLDAYKSTAVMDGLYQFTKKLSGGKPVFLVAHDWGGSISWLFASAHKEIIKALVILNVGHPLLFFREYMKGPGDGKPAQYDLSVYIRNIRSGRWNEDYYSANDFKNFADALFHAAPTFFDEQTRAEYRKAWAQVDQDTKMSAVTASLNYYRAMDLPDPGQLPRDKAQAPPKNLMRVEVPTLVLWGKDDSYVAEDVNKGLDQLVPDLTFKSYDGLTHWILHEDPGLVNREIDTFLKDRFPDLAKKSVDKAKRQPAEKAKK